MIREAFIAVAAVSTASTPAAADLSFFAEKCLDPFFDGSVELPTADLEAITYQGARFYRDPATQATLSGDLGNDWLRACNVNWLIDGQSNDLITDWQTLMLERGMEVPEECDVQKYGERQFYAGSAEPVQNGFFVLAQLYVKQDGSSAWAQMSESDSRYPIELECRDAK